MYGYEQTAPGGYPGDPYQQAGQPGMNGMYGQPGYDAQPSGPGGLGGYGEQPPAGQSLYPEPSPPSLADAVRAFTTGSMPVEDFQAIFITSKVHCPAVSGRASWHCTTPRRP